MDAVDGHFVCLEAIQEYIMDFRTSGPTSLRRVRLFVLGHERAGKTTLKRRMLLKRRCFPTGIDKFVQLAIFHYALSNNEMSSH